MGSTCLSDDVQALTAVALLCGGDYDDAGGAGNVGPRQAFGVMRKLVSAARQVPDIEVCHLRIQSSDPTTEVLYQPCACHSTRAACFVADAAHGCQQTGFIRLLSCCRRAKTTAMCWRSWQRS